MSGSDSEPQPSVPVDELLIPLKLGVFVIATRAYFDYATTLILSAERYVNSNLCLKFFLLTDDVSRATSLAERCERCEVVTSLIPSLGWPEATLHRFELMLEAWNHVDSDLVAYIDADMEFARQISREDFLLPLSNGAQMVLVQHPGYFNRNVVYNTLIRTLLGPWEHRRASKAFVPRRKRKRYVCGGIFWGTSLMFHELISELFSAVRADEGVGIRAKHNDESHLNRWAAEKMACFSAEPPSWAFDETYRHLRKITPILVAVRKPKSFRRMRT